MSGESAKLAMAEADNGDLALVHACKGGDISAFEELVRRYDRKLFRIAHHLVNNREDAEDVVQTAFLKAFQHLDQFRESAQFSTWLTRITMNQALMVLRKRRTTKEVSSDINFDGDEDHLPIEVADWSPNAEELYQAAELKDILRKTLRRLGPGLRAVFVLRDIEGFTLQETAEALDLSLAAVKARSLRARLRLRQGLSRYFNQEKQFEGAERSSGNSETGTFS